ncbi:MAG: FHA domain-containing protein [Bdellovibrionota bacterium]
MRLEVLADNTTGAVIYVLNRPEIYIGSTENNDIVIPANEVSKKHLKLLITDDKKCFVIDQGSTNGTFMNDERMIPGKREEFKLFTSIRLGEQVLLTLLDKDKGEVPELPLREQFVEEKKMVIADEDKTRVISLKSLQKVKTEKVRKKRLKSLEAKLKKKKTVRKDKATLNRAIITALIIIGGTFAAMKTWDLAKARKARRTIVGQIKETQLLVDEEIESFDENAADLKIPSVLLLPIAEITRHVEDVNCSLPEELYFCKRMPRGSRKKNGAVNINGQLVVYIEQKEWMDRAQALVATYLQNNAPSDEKLLTEQDKVAAERVEGQTEEDEGPKEEGSEETKTEALTINEELASIENLNKIATLSFMRTWLGRPIPQDYQEYNLYFVLYSHAGSEVEIQSVMAIRASALGQVNVRYSEDFFKSKKFSPMKIIRKLDRFYKLY